MLLEASPSIGRELGIRSRFQSKLPTGPSSVVFPLAFGDYTNLV
jgi:hypothetical protein